MDTVEVNKQTLRQIKTSLENQGEKIEQINKLAVSNRKRSKKCKTGYKKNKKELGSEIEKIAGRVSKAEKELEDAGSGTGNLRDRVDSLEQLLKQRLGNINEKVETNKKELRNAFKLMKEE